MRIVSYLVVLLTFGGTPTWILANDKPNVVVIVSDDAGWADFGFMDSITGRQTEIRTPNLDSLAARGVKFSNAYTAPVCAPSRAMVVTGQYGGRTGFWTNHVATSILPISQTTPGGLMPEVVTIWERMKAEGYTTSAIGKWHLGQHLDEVEDGQLIAPGNRPLQQGVDEYFGFLYGSRSDYYAGNENGLKRLSTQSLNSNGVVVETVVENDYAGQHITEIFGQKSADFIGSHYQDEDPFFMYTSFYAPHNPIHQSTLVESDYNDPLIADIVDDDRRRLAAATLTMDRAVGQILGKLDDPNGDGSNEDSIRDNTLVVFINDNGGDCCLLNGTNYADNGGLRRGKGSPFEGGIRVPMVVAGFGVDQSAHGTTFDSPVHAVDIVPTVVTAAGGTLEGEQVVDGVDLLPHVNGETADIPHESLFIPFFTNHYTAVRKGDFKLLHRFTPQLYNLATDRFESNNLASSMPEKVDEMMRELLSYHVQMDKPRSDEFGAWTSDFDHLRLRDDSGSTVSWSEIGIWSNGDTLSGNYRNRWLESYANTELSFPTREGSDYHATNNLTAISGLTYMLNRLNLTNQQEALVTANQATIDGRNLMFTKSRDGDLPVLGLDAHDEVPSLFTFDVQLDMDLYDDLVISGDGNQTFIISGQIIEYQPGRNISKTGSSRVVLQGGVAITGLLDVIDGEVDLAHNQMTGDLAVRSGASLIVGGEGSEATPTTLNIAGFYTQDGGSTLSLDLFSSESFDGIVAEGDASLGGSLVVAAAPGFEASVGQTYAVLDSASRSGQFDAIELPDLADDLMWHVDYTSSSVELLVAIAGDYNGDGTVNVADYTVWRDSLGMSGDALSADGDGSGTIDAGDYQIWRTNFGASAAAIIASQAQAVPEPANSIAILGPAMLACVAISRRAKLYRP